MKNLRENLEIMSQLSLVEVRYRMWIMMVNVSIASHSQRSLDHYSVLFYATIFWNIKNCFYLFPYSHTYSHSSYVCTCTHSCVTDEWQSGCESRTHTIISIFGGWIGPKPKPVRHGSRSGYNQLYIPAHTNITFPAHSIDTSKHID